MNLLIDSTVKVSLIVLVALVARALLRRRSAAVRHWVLSVAIACAAAMPLLAMMVPAWHIGPGVFSAPATSSERPPEAQSQSVASTTTTLAQGPVAPNRVRAGGSDTEASASIGSTMAGMAGPIWMIGAGISLLVLLAGLAHLKWLARGARQVDGGRWERLAKEISAAFELRQPVKLLQSDHPTLLVTWGVLQPKVILPAAARGWSDERVRVVLRHELAHIRRGDWAVFMAAEVLRAVYWFNPLVWIACRRVRQESEHACDDVVLNAGMDGSDYATHLLDLARTLHAHRRMLFPGPAAPAMARPSSLEGRIRTMLNASVNRRPLTRSSRVVTFVALLGLTVLIAGLGAQSFYTLSGTVIDSTNRILPDTKLVVTNAAIKAKHEVRTDRTGHFEFLGLPPGEYALEVSIPGFRTFKDTIPVVARNIDRTIRLEVGSLEETITVTGSVAGPPDPEPPADQAERRQQARSKAEARQQAVLDKCGSAPAGPMGGQILAPLALTRVNPKYPDNLRTSGIGGVVTMDAVIGTDGNIQEVRAVSSPHPDLESAAIEAVRQWQWTPTLLNCVPIEVSLRVTTRFNTQP